MNPTDEHLRTFFGRYAEALTAGDLKATSGCYAVPSLVLSDTGSVPIAAREEIEAAFDGAAKRYRAQGLVDVRPPSSPRRLLARGCSLWTCVGTTSTRRAAARSKTATATCSGSRTRRLPRSKSL